MLKRIALLLMVFWLAGCSESGQYASEFASSEQSAARGFDVAKLEPEAQFASAAELFAKKARDEMVDGHGKVVRLLPDDNKGSRHQKFLVEVEGGQTLLFAHNIDLALRIDTLKVGDTVQFRGEYSYNPKGGVVHWTHLDPQKKHEAGWIKHNGITYQ